MRQELIRPGAFELSYEIRKLLKSRPIKGARTNHLLGEVTLFKRMPKPLIG